MLIFVIDIFSGKNTIDEYNTGYPWLMEWCKTSWMYDIFYYL